MPSLIIKNLLQIILVLLFDTFFVIIFISITIRFTNQFLIILEHASFILENFHLIVIIATRSPKSIIDPFFATPPPFFFVYLSAHHDISLMHFNLPHRLKEAPSLPFLQLFIRDSLYV